MGTQKQAATARPLIRFEAATSWQGKRYPAARFGTRIVTIAGAVSPAARVWLVVNVGDALSAELAQYYRGLLLRKGYRHVALVEAAKPFSAKDVRRGLRSRRKKPRKVAAAVLFPLVNAPVPNQEPEF